MNRTDHGPPHLIPARFLISSFMWIVASQRMKIKKKKVFFYKLKDLFFFFSPWFFFFHSPSYSLENFIWASSRFITSSFMVYSKSYPNEITSEQIHTRWTGQVRILSPYTSEPASRLADQKHILHPKMGGRSHKRWTNYFKRVRVGYCSFSLL